MGLFHPETQVNIEQLNIFECSEPKHHHHFHDPHKRFRAFFSLNKRSSKVLIMALTLNPGQTDVVGIEIYDSITGNVLDQAVASNQQYAVDNASILTIAPDADTTKEDLTASAAGTANLSGSVTADLSAYGLGSGVVLSVPATPVTVASVVSVTPAARFVFAPPVTPTPAS
jgi:hypothetical protein